MPTPKRGPGRPRLDPLEKRSVAIFIKCTPAEREALREAAEREGEALGTWMREECLRMAAERGPGR